MSDHRGDIGVVFEYTNALPRDERIKPLVDIDCNVGSEDWSVRLKLVRHKEPAR